MLGVVSVSFVESAFARVKSGCALASSSSRRKARDSLVQEAEVAAIEDVKLPMEQLIHPLHPRPEGATIDEAHWTKREPPNYEVRRDVDLTPGAGSTACHARRETDDVMNRDGRPLRSPPVRTGLLECVPGCRWEYAQFSKESWSITMMYGAVTK